MSKTVEITVPDIGGFKDVSVIEIHVKAGDHISAEDSLVTLESDKAAMEIPSPHSGVVKEVKIALNDKVSQGSPLIGIQVPEEDVAATPAPAPVAGSKAAPAQGDTVTAEVLVLGAGPGGYTAAFRAADLGKKVVLVERYPTLGGVCLNVGCIPSKALLHTAQIINEAADMGKHGVNFGKPEVDLNALRAWKESVISRLTGGLAQLADKRKVQTIQGVAEFSGANTLNVATSDGPLTVQFEQAIIAAGSSSTRIPGFPYEDSRLMDSTGALALKDIPKRLLIIGGGIIGLEMATVYAALGSKITVVELMDSLIPGCDKDLVRPLQRRIQKIYENIFLGAKVSKIESRDEGLKVFFEGGKAPESDVFDRVLLAVGRRPNGFNIGAEKAGVEIDGAGFIPVDKQQRTNIPYIFAIGDITGNPMLAHKAVHEGKVAAEVSAGMRSVFDARTIPSVAYTDPEIAWMGLTETEAKQQGIEFEKGAFPWAASGRSLSLGRDEGLTKLLFDKETGRLLGAGMVGPNAGELVAETVLALEMDCEAADLGLTIHPHPTLSETVNFAAEVAEGTITDLYIPRKKN